MSSCSYTLYCAQIQLAYAYADNIVNIWSSHHLYGFMCMCTCGQYCEVKYSSSSHKFIYMCTMHVELLNLCISWREGRYCEFSDDLHTMFTLTAYVYSLRQKAADASNFDLLRITTNENFVGKSASLRTNLVWTQPFGFTPCRNYANNHSSSPKLHGNRRAIIVRL